MGQRLVINIKNNGEDLARIYYHWSAYTESALQEAKDLIECIYNGEDETEKELQLRLIRFCENRGGGIRGDKYEFDYIKNMFPGETFKEDNYSRSYGLIALSEKGMEDVQSWSEGDMEINLDNEMVFNSVYCGYDSIEEYNAERSSWDDEYEPLKLEDIPDIGFDLYKFGIDDIDTVIRAVNNVNGYVARHGTDIYDFIA